MRVGHIFVQTHLALRLTQASLFYSQMDTKSTQRKDNIWQSELLTVKEVAIYLRVSRVTVWRWCQQGTIPAFRVGRNWRIRRADLLALEEHPVG